MEEILNSLNPQQKAAVLHTNTSLRIIAGAGSGKTRVLTSKIVYLIKKLKVSPNKILAVTFTNKAAKEMRERVSKILDKDIIANISTFHSMCHSILKREIKSLGYPSDFEVLDASDQKRIINKIIKSYEEDIKELEEEQRAFISAKNLSEYISNKKNSFILPDTELENLENEKKSAKILKAKIYRKYQEELSINKYLDFDDLQIFVHQLFTQFPAIAKKWSEKYNYVLVDEFQDTSLVQFEILKKLTLKKNNLTVVGDPDQTIYSWRGVDVQLILNFEKEYTNSDTIYLEQNYRSTKKILEHANKLIKHNKKRLEKNLFTDNEDGEPFEYYQSFSQEAEARWVSEKINKLKKEKVQLKNIVILIRANYYSRVFEENFIRENIGYQILGGDKFYQIKEIKDAISFLKIIHDKSDNAFARVINVPSRKVGDKSQEKIFEYAHKLEKTAIDALVWYFQNRKEIINDPEKKHLDLDLNKNVMKNLVGFLNSIGWAHAQIEQKQTISKVLKKFLKAIDYFSIYKENYKTYNNAKDNMEELMKSIDNWEKNNPTKGLGDYLDEITLLTSNEIESDNKTAVNIMTVHLAKGLEFNYVFLVGMSEGVFPSRKVLDKNLTPEIEEERRLAYVAITRAKTKVYVSNVITNYDNNINFNKVSRFVDEMGIKYNKKINDYMKKDINGNVLYQKDNNSLIAGDRIQHITFGSGIIVEVDGDTIVVKFDNIKEYKTLLKNHKSLQKEKK